MLTNIFPSDQLRGLASRKARADEFRSVRNALVDEEVARGWNIATPNKTTTRLSKQKTHDRLLEDRVWTLMYRMGFHQLSGNGGAYLKLKPDEPDAPENQIDIVAIDDEVAFAIECKSAERVRKFPDFS
jgi:hypothetical protein